MQTLSLVGRLYGSRGTASGLNQEVADRESFRDWSWVKSTFKLIVKLKRRVVRVNPKTTHESNRQRAFVRLVFAANDRIVTANHRGEGYISECRGQSCECAFEKQTRNRETLSDYWVNKALVKTFDHYVDSALNLEVIVSDLHKDRIDWGENWNLEGI